MAWRRPSTLSTPSCARLQAASSLSLASMTSLPWLLLLLLEASGAPPDPEALLLVVPRGTAAATLCVPAALLRWLPGLEEVGPESREALAVPGVDSAKRQHHRQWKHGCAFVIRHEDRQDLVISRWSNSLQANCLQHAATDGLLWSPLTKCHTTTHLG